MFTTISAKEYFTEKKPNLPLLESHTNLFFDINENKKNIKPTTNTPLSKSRCNYNFNGNTNIVDGDKNAESFYSKDMSDTSELRNSMPALVPIESVVNSEQEEDENDTEEPEFEDIGDSVENTDTNTNTDTDMAKENKSESAGKNSLVDYLMKKKKTEYTSTSSEDIENFSKHFQKYMTLYGNTGQMSNGAVVLAPASNVYSPELCRAVDEELNDQEFKNHIERYIVTPTMNKPAEQTKGNAVVRRQKGNGLVISFGLDRTCNLNTLSDYSFTISKGDKKSGQKLVGHEDERIRGVQKSNEYKNVYFLPQGNLFSK